MLGLVYRARAAAGLSLLLLGACTTLPDVSGFGDQTMRLQSAGLVELAEVEARFEAALQVHDGLSEEIKRSHEANFEATRNAQAVVSATSRSAESLLNGITAYSEDVVALVAAADDGKGAATTIFGNLNGIVALAVPGAAPIISETLTRTGDEILAAANEVQVAANLREAITEAHPGMEAAGEALEALFGPSCPADPESRAAALSARQCEIWERGLRAIGDRHADWLKLSAGRESIEFYEQARVKRDQIYQGLRRAINESDAEGFCTSPDGATPRGCLTPTQEHALEMLEERMTAIEPAALAFRRQQDAIAAWKAVRVQNASVIRQAVRAWVAEHKKLRDSLQNCDFTVFGACARVSGGGIKAALERLRIVIHDQI